MKDRLSGNPGWSARQSIALELDLASVILSGSVVPRGAVNLPEFAPLFQSIPAAWLEEQKELMQDARGFHSPLEILSILADVVFEVDYSRATLAMRELTFQSVSEKLQHTASLFDIHPDPSLPEEERLADLYLKQEIEKYQRVGITVNQEYQNTLRQGMLFTLRLIQGGDLHERFWHWLDRFYYEDYAPWRSGRVKWLEEQENQVVAFLGASEKHGSAPDLSWMSKMSPVLRHPGVKSAVEKGESFLYLWEEPFGIPDAWVMLPGAVMSTFAQPGVTVDSFQSFTDELAGRLAALSDPTRLFILRLIRNIDMTNTDMAEYLKLSRPTVSIHARVLREAGLIRSHQDGRSVRHEIVTEEVHKLFHDLETFLDLPAEIQTPKE